MFLVLQFHLPANFDRKIRTYLCICISIIYNPQNPLPPKDVRKIIDLKRCAYLQAKDTTQKLQERESCWSRPHVWCISSSFQMHRWSKPFLKMAKLLTGHGTFRQCSEQSRCGTINPGDGCGASRYPPLLHSAYRRVLISIGQWRSRVWPLCCWRGP